MNIAYCINVLNQDFRGSGQHRCRRRRRGRRRRRRRRHPCTPGTYYSQ